MRKIFLSAGHTNVKGKDRGAAANGVTEGDLTVELRDLITTELKNLGVNPTIDDNSHGLRKTLAKFKNLTAKDSLVVDIHFNAATPKAKGVETLVPNEANDLELNLAQKLSSTIANILETSLRGSFKGRKGVKSEISSHHGRLGWMRLTGNNVLLEICFITNKPELDKYLNNKHLIAKNIAAILVKASSIENKSTKIKTNQINSVSHIVREGDTLWGIARKHNMQVSELKKLNNLTSDTIHKGDILKIM